MKKTRENQIEKQRKQKQKNETTKETMKHKEN